MEHSFKANNLCDLYHFYNECVRDQSVADKQLRTHQAADDAVTQVSLLVTNMNFGNVGATGLPRT